MRRTERLGRALLFSGLVRLTVAVCCFLLGGAAPTRDSADLFLGFSVVWTWTTGRQLTTAITAAIDSRNHAGETERGLRRGIVREVLVIMLLGLAFIITRWIWPDGTHLVFLAPLVASGLAFTITSVWLRRELRSESYQVVVAADSFPLDRLKAADVFVEP